MFKRLRRGTAIIASVMVALSSVTAFNMEVTASNTYTTLQGVSWVMESGWDKTVPESEVESVLELRKENIEYIWGFLRANNFTEVAAAAILGNFEAESNINHTASEGGTADGKDGRGLAQWTTVGTGGAGTGCHKKLSDFAVASEHKHEAGTPQYANQAGNTWLGCIECQMNFFISDPSYGNKSLGRAQGYGTVASGITNLLTFGSFDFIEYKNGNVEQAVREATESFCLRWEVPRKSTCKMQKRVQYALAIYEKYTGTEINIDGNSMKTKDGNTIKFDGNILATYNEAYFIGEKYGLHDNAILLPDNSYLNISDRFQLTQWKNNVEYMNADSKHGFLRGGLMFVGIMIIVYSTLLFMAFQFDKINNFIEIEVLGKLTFGKLLTARDDISTYATDEKNKPKLVVQKDIIIVTLSGIAIGVLILTGKLYAILAVIIKYATLWI